MKSPKNPERVQQIMTNVNLWLPRLTVAAVDHWSVGVLFEYEPKIAPLALMRGADSKPSGVTDRPSPTDFPRDPNPVPG